MIRYKFNQNFQSEIWLVLFIETVDDKNRQQLEMDYTDSKTGVIVHPIFVQTGGE